MRFEDLSKEDRDTLVALVKCRNEDFSRYLAVMFITCYPPNEHTFAVKDLIAKTVKEPISKGVIKRSIKIIRENSSGFAESAVADKIVSCIRSEWLHKGVES